MGKDGILSRIKLIDPLKRSTYSNVSVSEVTEDAVEVWRGLPEIIRQDPSLASFRQQHENLHSELLCVCVFFPIKLDIVIWITFSIKYQRIGESSR